MAEKVNPSPTRPAEAFKTAGVIAQAGGSADGFIVRGSSPTELSTQDGGIAEGNLNTFAETSSGTSFDVTIDPGEAFVYGSWLAIDTSTTVTLSSSTNDQTVYVGWNKDGTNDVIIGLSSAFATASGDTDEKIPLFDFDTDGSGVTSVTDRRTIGKSVTGRFIENTNTISSNYTTDGEQLIFVDTSSSAVTVTLSTSDLDSGSTVTVTDVGGNAGTNNITIDTQGSATIDGATSDDILQAYGTAVFGSDGSNWYSAGGGGGGAFVDTDGDNIGELLGFLNGIQFPDDAVLQFGTNQDYVLKYDSTDDRLELTGDQLFFEQEEILAGAFLHEQTVDSGSTVKIESDTSSVVVGPYTVNGTLDVDGSFKVL